MATYKLRPIRLLDDATIDRIAAGEVIERPASVVKELIENALDADAHILKIDISEGGMASIRVEDDGQGIRFHDLPLAFERHATSKIASAADIVQVGSFGFRGEALASIAAVSRCDLISRCEAESVGGLIRIVGGATEQREPAPRNRGTTVTVAELFYNTPARRKFLATAAAEKRAVVNVVTALALAHPEIRWQLVADGTTVLDFRPVESLPARAKDILGSSVMEHLAKFAGSEGGLTASGLASRPTWTRGNRTQQFLYVNRRPIRSAALSQAIAQAYREVIPPGRHPVVILFLQIPLGEVDVNVHPAKSEVRMLLERRVFSLVRSALLDGLNLRQTSPFSQKGLDDTIPTTPPAPTDPTVLAGLAQAQSDYLRRHFQAQPATRTGGEGSWSGGAAGQSELFTVSEKRKETVAAGELILQSAPFWQLHRTFILTQIRGGLVLIDQHNSHERILYNEAKQALEEGEASIPTQQLLFPAHLELTPTQLQAYHGHRNQLAALGFTVEPFGGQSVLVQGIPTSLKNWTEGQLFLDILDDLAAGGRDSDESRKDLLASYACHGAIRAGELLTLPEMQNLVDQLFATDLPLSCPHGRPTLIEFSLEELEKRFGRR